jgi:hypothetical protein
MTKDSPSIAAPRLVFWARTTTRPCPLVVSVMGQIHEVRGKTGRRVLARRVRAVDHPILRQSPAPALACPNIAAHQRGDPVHIVILLFLLVRLALVLMRRAKGKMEAAPPPKLELPTHALTAPTPPNPSLHGAPIGAPGMGL